MVRTILLFVAIAISFALLGSLIFQSISPNLNTSQVKLEQKCEIIAKEGFIIHTSYPDLNPDQLPTGAMNRLLHLDEIWIKDCVSKLPTESIFNIIQKVEHDFYSGE